MQREMYKIIESYMLTCMNDGAHDSQHIYRVLYSSLDIAKDYEAITDVLMAAALLHDIGRDAQYKDAKLDHAAVGAEMAYDFFKEIGWPETSAKHVKDCISTHRYRNNNFPESIEAKILFDADKLDAAGTMGIARTLAYNGIVGDPLYCTDEQGNVLTGEAAEPPSFFHEYNKKLKNIYERFYTDRAREIALSRQRSGIEFYKSMYEEVKSIHTRGLEQLNQELE